MPRDAMAEWLAKRNAEKAAQRATPEHGAVRQAQIKVDQILEQAKKTVTELPGVKAGKTAKSSTPVRQEEGRDAMAEWLAARKESKVQQIAEQGMYTVRNAKTLGVAVANTRAEYQKAHKKAARHVAVNTTAPLAMAEAARYQAKFLSGRSVDKVQREYDTTRERAEEYRQKALRLRETGDAQREASSTAAIGKDREDETRFGSSLTRSADQWDKLAQEESSKALELARELGYAKVYQVQELEENAAMDPQFAQKAQARQDILALGAEESRASQSKANVIYGEINGSEYYVTEDPATEKMTETERRTFTYLYNTKGAAAAEEYYNMLNDTLELRRGEDIAAGMGGTAKKTLFSLGMGVRRFGRGIEQLFNDEQLPLYGEDYAENIINASASHGERILYSAANSIGNMLPMVAISAATQGIGGAVGLSAEAAQAAGKAAGVASMFAGAKGNAYTEAMQQGMTKAQASTYSTLVGASEAGLEYLIGGISQFSMGSGIGDFVQEAISGLGRGYARVAFRFAGSLIGGSIDEIIEENTQNYLEPLFINYVTGKEAEMPGWDEFIETTLSTLITTGVMESRNSFVEAKQNIAFTPFEAQLEWVSAAKNVFAEGTDVAEFADVLESRLQAGDPMSYKEFREGIRALGVDEKTMDRIAKGKLTVDEVLTSAENGDKISLKEWQAEQNSTAQQEQSQTQRAETVQTENDNIETAMTAAEQEADRLIAEWNRGENSSYELGQQAQRVMQQLEEEVREGTATDPGSYINRQLQLQEIVRSAPEASTAQQATQNTTERIDNNGRTEILNDSEERNAGLGAGEQAGAVAEGAGGPVAGGAGTQTQNGRADLSGGREAVSAREIGVKGGTAEKNIHVVIPAEIDTTQAADAAIVEKMNRIVTEAAAKGQDVTFVSGALTVESGGRTVRVEGVRQTGDNGRTQIFLQVDGRRDMERIYRHEDFHDAVEAQPGLLQRLADRLMQEYGREEMLRMAIDYAEAYDGIYGEFTEDMTEEQENELAIRYMEEVFADAYAGIRRGQRRIRSAQKTLEASGEIETLRARGQTAQNAQEEQSGKLSIADGLLDKLRRVAENRYRGADEIYIGETSDFLTREIGVDAAKVTMPASKAYAAMVTAEQAKVDNRYDKNINYHGLGAEGMLEILEKSENPVAAFVSKPGEKGSRLNRLVLVTDQEINGGNAVVVEEIEAQGRLKGKKLKVNKVITAYERERAAQDVQDAQIDGRLLYLDKKRSQSLNAGRPGSNSPVAMQSSDFQTNIQNFLADVKWESGEYDKKVSGSGPVESDIAAAFRKSLEKKTSFSVSGDQNGQDGRGKQRFSLSEPVERAGNLIAEHNLTQEKLEKALEIGAFPSPSIAIVQAEQGHTNYGDYSVVFPASTIDPEADSRNRVYGADAWTPTSSNATVEYRVDADAKRAFERSIRDLSGQVADGIFRGDSTLGKAGIEEETTKTSREIAEQIAQYPEVKAAYLADKGENISPVYKDREYDNIGNAALQRYTDNVGAQDLAWIIAQMDMGDAQSVAQAELQRVRQAIGEEYAERFARILDRRPERKAERVSEYAENKMYSSMRAEDFIRHAWEMVQDGGRNSGEADKMAMQDELDRKAPVQDVAAWAEKRLQDVIGEGGIYNNEDRYTSRGDRRSFDQTHWELNAENLVRAMAQAEERGANIMWYDAGGLLAAATPEYRSISEIHADEGRLQTLEQEAYEGKVMKLQQSLDNVVERILQETKHKAYGYQDESQLITEALIKTAQGGDSLQSIREGMAAEEYDIDRATAMRVQELFQQAKEIPTSYFEAKPQRVVSFDEAVALLAPESAPASLMARAEDAGLRVIRYTDDADRIRVANELPGVKFSVQEEQDAGESQKQDTQKDLGEMNRQVQGAEAAMRSDALKAQADAELQEYLKKGKSELAQSISKMSDAALKKQTERVKQAMTAESEGLRINEAAEAVTEGVQKYAESRNQRLGDMLQMIKAEQNKRAAEKREAEKQRRAEARKTPEAKLQRQIDKLQKQIDIERAALRQAKQGGTLTSEMAEQSEERITGLRQEILDYKNELQEKKTAAREEKKRQQDQAAKEAILKEKPRQATRDLTNALIESFNVPEANRTQATIQIRELAEQAYQEGQKGPITNELRNKMLDTLIELGTEREMLDNRESEISQRLREKWIQVPDEVRTAFGEEWADIKESAYDSGIYFTYKDGYRSIQSWTAELQKEFGQMFDTTRSPQQQLRDIVNLASEGYGKQMTIGDMLRQNADDYSWSMREKVEELGKVLDDQLQRFGEKANIEVKLAARSAKSLQAQQQYFENRLRSRTEQQMESLAREKLLKSAKQLRRMANKSSAEQRAAIQKVIGNIDLVARSITPDGIENLQELALSYRQAMEAMGENFIRDKDVEDRLARLGKKRIAEMDDMDEVRQLAQDITAVATQIRNQNQMLATVRRETVSEMAENVRKEVKAAKGSNAGKARDFVLMQTDAKRFFLELGGWKEDGATAELLHGLERGEEKRRLYEMRAQGLFNGFLADNANKKWFESATGKDAQWITVDTPRGASVIKDGTASAISELTMTPMMRVSLIMHSKNEDNLRHIAEGGMRVPNRALYKKGNISEAYARGDVVTLTPQAVRDIVRGATAQEIQFAAILSKYFDGQAKNAINEVSMVMDGYEKAMVKNYFPIESDRAFTVQDNDQVRNDISLTGLGFLKQRTGKGANPVLLQDASQTFQRSVESVSKYYGLALPIRDLNAIMNSTYYENAGKVRLSQTDKLLGRDRSKEGGGAIRTQSAESVRNVIAGKWGKSSINYIEKLVGDLQRSGKDMDAFSGFFGWLRGQYASAVISFNPSSMLKQWGSYATAMAYLSPGDLAAGLLRGMKGKVSTDTLGQYSSVYWYRNQGNATQELHDLTTNEALVTKLPLGYNWAQAMDSFITRRLMLACERNVSRTTGLTPGTSEEINSGTDAYWTKVATLFNKVVLDTQSNSSILERAAVARANPNNISRFMTMFRADAFQSFNLLREGQGKYQSAREAYLQNKTAENRRAMIAARKQLARSGAAVIASQFVSASISVMINALRRRDELWDEDGLNWGEVMKQLGLGMVEGLAGISIAGEELVGLVESIAFDETWYGPDVNALQLLTDTAESAISAAKILKNGKWELAPGALKDLALEASTVMGLPLKNVEKYVQVLPRWVAPELMAEYDNIWDEVDRNALSKSSVLDIKADIGVLLDNRTDDMSDEDKEELTRLYLAGGTGALPAAVPNSVKYNNDSGEEVTVQLDYSQKQTYKKEWSKIVSGAIGALLKSDLYNEADDKTKTKMLNNLYTYANGLSAEKVVPEKAADGWIDDARTISGEGVKIADYIQWHTMLSEMDSDDASGTGRTGLKNARAMELANEKGWTWAVPSGAPDELKWMEDDTEQTLQLTDAQKKQYRKTWTGIVYGSVGDLMQSDEYQSGSEKERGALIQKLTSYASALAAYEIEPKKEPDTWILGGQQAVKDGVPLDEYIVFRALYSELDSINEDGDEESGLKNKRTLDLIESMGWSDQAEQSAYINTVASESKAAEAEALQKAGMTWEQANDVLAVPGTGVAKKVAVTATNASEAAKAKVLASYDKSEKQKTAKLVMTGLKYGIPMRRYTDVLQNADADGSGGVSQEEAGKYIATLGLSVQEAAYLWQMVTNGKEGKKNPFSSYFGSEFYSAAGAFD